MNQRKNRVTIIDKMELKMKNITKGKNRYNIGNIIMDQEDTMLMFINILDIDTTYVVQTQNI